MLAITSLLFTLPFMGLAFVTGRAAMHMLKLEAPPPWRWITWYLSAPLGLGLLISVLFLLASLDCLSAPVLAWAGILLALASWSILGFRLPGFRDFRDPDRLTPWLLLFIAYTLLIGLEVSLEWDEMSYHLPYARDYAAHGGLVVSEYLRFPLHSHNYQLLYATALIFSNELAAHQIHAVSGLLVLVGIFLFTRKMVGKAVGWLAGFAFLWLSYYYFATAYVDLGLALFVFSAFICLFAWQSQGNASYLYLTAFMLGIAIGIKYQGLVQLLPFAVALLVDKRSRPFWVGMAATLLLFGSWWYVRNFLLSGNPVHPMASSVFGYWIWNEVDLAKLYGDINKFDGHLPWLIWPAFGSLFLVSRQPEWYRTLVVLGGLGILVWYLTSRYDRYLLPTLPFLCILSGHVLQRVWRRWAPAQRRSGRGSKVLPITLGSLLVLLLASDVIYSWDRICFTKACVSQIRAQNLLSHDVKTSFPGFADLNIYQLGLENELFALDRPVLGDWFGRYRYSDLLALDDSEAAAYLRSIGADALLVNHGREPFATYLGETRLEPELQKVWEDSSVVLFVLPEANGMRQ